ncbi:hypothetical protein CLAFUR4_12174 [Fulvia fulva]|nr:hypothetical protein CLAFUR4_12174 [Fulvia fulva]
MLFPSGRLRNAILGGLLFLLLLIALGSTFVAKPDLLSTFHNPFASSRHPHFDGQEWTQASVALGQDVPGATSLTDLLTPEQKEASDRNNNIKHNIVKSSVTKDGRWFLVDFGEGYGSYNPSILPHPSKEETWIVIAQRDKQEDDNDTFNVELVCEATFNRKASSVQCIPGSVMILPIRSTTAGAGQCEGDLEYMKTMIGPHDARIFFGPSQNRTERNLLGDEVVFESEPVPYVMYGSQGTQSCVAMWMQDLRRLVDWNGGEGGHLDEKVDPFFWGTQLARPGMEEVQAEGLQKSEKEKRIEAGTIEKNWFAFWDSAGDLYIHQDIKPTYRAFSKILDPFNATTSPDLAPLATTDTHCMTSLMPALQPTNLEWIHQSTNSLSLTLCRRLDPGCEPSDDNTFILTLFQVKTFYYHGVYEPYVMLFRQRAPFEIYGITQKPLWYYGRGRPGGDWTTGTLESRPHDQSEMVFTTSVSFMGRGRGYHGYLDDKVMISFGIEDQKSGGIDVVAEDLVKSLELC